jgi:hypothetical protein
LTQRVYRVISGCPWLLDGGCEPPAREASQADFSGFRAFFDAAHEHLQAQHPVGVAGQEPPSYKTHQQLRLNLPANARASAAATVGGRQAIPVLLAGSSAGRHLYPSAGPWALILGALARELAYVGSVAEEVEPTEPAA